MKLELKKIEYPVKCIDPDKVHQIADSLFSEGQTHPITVAKNRRGTYSVLDGDHRVEAARLLGWSLIECNLKEADTLGLDFNHVFDRTPRYGKHIVVFYVNGEARYREVMR